MAERVYRKEKMIAEQVYEAIKLGVSIAATHRKFLHRNSVPSTPEHFANIYSEEIAEARFDLQKEAGKNIEDLIKKNDKDAIFFRAERKGGWIKTEKVEEVLGEEKEKADESVLNALASQITALRSDEG